MFSLYISLSHYSDGTKWSLNNPNISIFPKIVQIVQEFGLWRLTVIEGSFPQIQELSDYYINYSQDVFTGCWVEWMKPLFQLMFYNLLLPLICQRISDTKFQTMIDQWNPLSSIWGLYRWIIRLISVWHNSRMHCMSTYLSIHIFHQEMCLVKCYCIHNALL